MTENEARLHVTWELRPQLERKDKVLNYRLDFVRELHPHLSTINKVGGRKLWKRSLGKSAVIFKYVPIFFSSLHCLFDIAPF